MSSEKFPEIQQKPFENKMLKQTVRENINENFEQLFNAIKLIQDEIKDGHTGCSGGGGTQNHALLSNLEYEDSNHKGFQAALKAGENIKIEQNVISASTSGLIVRLD